MIGVLYKWCGEQLALQVAYFAANLLREEKPIKFKYRGNLVFRSGSVSNNWKLNRKGAEAQSQI